MSCTRRRFTSEQKALIVRLHLANNEPVSALAEQFGLQPSQIHSWVNMVLAQADNPFERSAENGRSGVDWPQEGAWVSEHGRRGRSPLRAG